MENFEQTTMTIGVAQQIGIQSSNKEDMDFRNDQGYEAEDIHENKGENSELSQESSAHKDADRLRESVKEEGIEGALIHFAERDLDDPEVGDEKNIQVSLNENIKDSESVSEEMEEVERVQVLERIKDLESQVVDLEEKNKIMFEKVKSLENNNVLALQSLIEMTLVLKELLKDEEDEKEKASMLTILVEMMTQIMKAMFVPESEKQDKYPSHQQKTKSSGKRSIEEIVRDLREKGLVGASHEESSGSEAEEAEESQNLTI